MKFSIIVPLFNTPVSFFWDMVNSVVEQVYENWELILVNASPNNAALSAELVRLSDSRIKVVTLTENKGIAENTNAGIEAASGDYIVFFDHDDTLDRFAYVDMQNRSRLILIRMLCIATKTSSMRRAIMLILTTNVISILTFCACTITSLICFAFVPRWLKS